MNKYLYLTLLMVPALSHAMEEKKKQKALASVCVDQGSQKSGSLRNNGRRNSFPNIFDFFKKKSSTGSLDIEYLDGSSLESAPTPRTTTPRSGGMPRGNTRSSRSSADVMSPRFNVTFDSVVKGKDDDNIQITYEIDMNGRPIPNYIDYIDEDDDSAPASPISPSQYNVNREYRKNPALKTKDRTCKPYDTLSDEVKNKVLSAEGQFLPTTVGTPQVARRVKYATPKAMVCKVVTSDDDVERYTFKPQNAKFSYHVDADADSVAVAATTIVMERKAHESQKNNQNLDHLIAMVESTTIASDE